MAEIKTIYDIQQLAMDGFDDWKSLGNVYTKKNGDLLLFNYTPEAQFEARWNFLELVSRGLIINAKTGEVVARPFDKFFNWGEGERVSTGNIISVTEKIDGSLGILYRDCGQYKIATRGSFDGEQAIWATEFLNQHHDLNGCLESVTLLFEIVYPENRIVIDYQGREDLVLLAVRNRLTGAYYPWSTVENIAHTFGFGLPKSYRFDAPEQILEAAKRLDGNSEGWVVEFDDGQRFKIKGEKYLELHKLITGLSFKWVLDSVISGTVESARQLIPDEFLGQVNQWVDEIETTVNQLKAQTEAAFEVAPKTTRKDYALWVQRYHKPIAPYLFARLDGKDILPLIYKMAFQNKTTESKEGLLSGANGTAT